MLLNFSCSLLLFTVCCEKCYNSSPGWTVWTRIDTYEVETSTRCESKLVICCENQEKQSWRCLFEKSIHVTHVKKIFISYSGISTNGHLKNSHLIITVSFLIFQSAVWINLYTAITSPKHLCLRFWVSYIQIWVKVYKHQNFRKVFSTWLSLTNDIKSHVCMKSR